MASRTSGSGRRISRRRVITHAAAVAVGGGAATLLGAGGPVAAQAPVIQTGAQAGRQFRAFVVRPTGGSVEAVRMNELDPDRVVVRAEASQIDYTIVNQVDSYPVPRIPGHGGVGIVEAVGSRVRRVQVGDRVVVANTPYCGQCYTCLRGRSDRCQMLPGAGNPLLPIGTLSDGVEVVQHNNEGGLGELMITYEWYCIPVFYDVDPVELAVVGCAGAFGLGTVFGIAPVEPGSDVAVLGCGPCGLSAIQGARIKGASQIIAVEPIRARRELALELGASIALDPNVEGDNLVTRVRELCSGPVDRRFAGGRNPSTASNAVGPGFVIEAVGGDVVTPAVEQGPDPTGILSLQQAWDMCSAAGHVTTGSVFQRGNFSVPGGQWSNGAKNHHPGNMNGVNGLRDIPMFARLIQTGQFNARALATSTYPLDQTLDALRVVGERTTIGAVLVF